MQAVGSQHALIAAASRGDLVAVERLLRGGADPNVRDERGRTALHEAIAGGHAETAACLLAYGASHARADDRGRLPLSLAHTPRRMLHAVRQRYRRFRRQEGPHGRPGTGRVEEWANELDRRGIVKVSGLIEPDGLGRMQDDFRRFVLQLEDKLRRGEGVYRHYDEEEHLWPKDRALVTNNAFKYSTQLVRWCCRGPLAEVANRYYGRDAYVSRGVAMRYLPSPATTNDMFGWHHDMEDRRLKLMVLLTDVGEQDQAMSYVLGSHTIFHPYPMFLQNSSSIEYCRQHLPEIEIFRAAGKAGDVFLFDSNGTHRGNRREGAAVRDVFLVEYATEKSDVWGGDICPQAFDGLPPAAARAFAWMLDIGKKWEKPCTRRRPTWVENLPHVERWL